MIYVDIMKGVVNGQNLLVSSFIQQEGCGVYFFQPATNFTLLQKLVEVVQPQVHVVQENEINWTRQSRKFYQNVLGNISKLESINKNYLSKQSYFTQALFLSFIIFSQFILEYSFSGIKKLISFALIRRKQFFSNKII